jgi:CheY-like chemotaxis protein
MTTQEGPRHPPGLHVLIVEDNPDTAETLALVIGLYGHETRVAPNGWTALDLAGERLPDAVLLDIGLPGMDGWEVARRLRARAGPARLLLVAVTAYGAPEDVRRSREAGIDVHLVKPVAPEEIDGVLCRSRGPAGER